MGKHRVGLCAGSVQVATARSELGSFRLPPYVWKLRCTFIIIGLCMILLCAALAGPGMTNMTKTSQSIRDSNMYVQDLIADGLVILDSVESVKRNVEPLDVSSMMNIKAACPRFETNLFLPVNSLQSTITAADGKFNELRQVLQLSDFDAMYQIVDDIWTATEHIDTATTIFEEHDWIVKLFVLFLGGLTFFMILRTVVSLSCRHKFRPLSALTELFILPLFVEATIIIWIATSAIASVSIPNAGKSKEYE